MKRKYLFLIATISLSFLMNSCGGSDSIDKNTAPTVPNQIFPLNNEICIENSVVFQWSKSTDADGDLVSYHVEVSEDDSFENLLKSETSFSESIIITLETGKAYFWRVKAIDHNSTESNYSPVMQFVTEGEGTVNHVPFPPTLMSPANNTEVEGANISINWTASDVDGDPLTFDVYIDTTENPKTKVSENQTETTYNAANLVPATKYYFKVIVKDDKGAISVGQVWSFSTK
jgi:hypothetical protein